MTKKNKLNLAVIGCGYWGPNFVRMFNELPDSNIKWCSDLDETKLTKLRMMYPSTKTTTDYSVILNDPEVDAVCISTPAITHFKIGKESLLHDKHVLIEKPLTLKSSEAKELITLAKERNRILMVGQIYEYHPGINKLKKFILNGELGEIYYVHSSRVGLGPIRKDANAMWDLAPHDISILLYLLEENPVYISAVGRAYLQQGIEDVVFMTLMFKRIIANIRVSWLDPLKKRELTMIGTKKMAVFDDASALEQLRIFDSGVTKMQSPLSYGEFRLSLRRGSIFVPEVDVREPLMVECQHFLESMLSGKQSARASGEKGLKVVKILEAAQESLEKSGAPVRVKV